MRKNYSNALFINVFICLWCKEEKFNLDLKHFRVIFFLNKVINVSHTFSRGFCTFYVLFAKCNSNNFNLFNSKIINWVAIISLNLSCVLLAWMVQGKPIYLMQFIFCASPKVISAPLICKTSNTILIFSGYKQKWKLMGNW